MLKIVRKTFRRSGLRYYREDKTCSSQQVMVAGEDTPESYLGLKYGVDRMLENSFFAIELLITGTVFQITVLVALRYR